MFSIPVSSAVGGHEPLTMWRWGQCSTTALLPLAKTWPCPTGLSCICVDDNEKSFIAWLPNLCSTFCRNSLFDMDETESLATNFSPIWTKWDASTIGEKKYHNLQRFTISLSLSLSLSLNFTLPPHALSLSYPLYTHTLSPFFSPHSQFFCYLPFTL
jgi:hypothetical protein